MRAKELIALLEQVDPDARVLAVNPESGEPDDIRIEMGACVNFSCVDPGTCIIQSEMPGATFEQMSKRLQVPERNRVEQVVFIV